MSAVNIINEITELPGGAVKLGLKAVGEGMPSAVFAIEVLPKSRDPLDVNYRFSHVCSVSELVEFPAEEDPKHCYFRTDEIEMIFDTITLALKVRENVVNDVNNLVLLYNQLSDLEIQGTTITISGSTVPGTSDVAGVHYQCNS